LIIRDYKDLTEDKKLLPITLPKAHPPKAVALWLPVMGNQRNANLKVLGKNEKYLKRSTIKLSVKILDKLD